MTATDSLRGRLLLSSGLLLLIALNWVPALDDRAAEYVRGATLDSLATFAAAKGLNAAISVAQSFEVGVGMSVSPFEFLDPLNDLVERFSGFLMYGLTALGLHQLLLLATSALWLKALFTLVLGGMLLACWLRPLLPPLLVKFCACLLLLRFALIVEVGVSWVLDEAYFGEREGEAVATLQQSSEQVLNARQRYIEARDEGSWWDGVKSAFSFDIPTSEQAGVGQQTTSAVIELIVILLVRSILLPVLVLWLLLKTLVVVWRRPQAP